MRAGALLVVLVCLVGCAGEAPRPVTLDFEKDEIGRAPAAFSVGVTGGGGDAAWVVSEDETARSGRKVLLQGSADPTSDRVPVCVYEGVVTRDLRATVKLRIDSGAVDQAGGLVFRYSPENYYIVRASALENKVAIWKTVRAKGSLVVDASVKVTAGEW
ncbi:MAG TPA: hypothetical protein VFF73_18480, partial [Planctomycetota bacterium]|nr:hypothetical protein [Planctomycetota bacterium]